MKITKQYDYVQLTRDELEDAIASWVNHQLATSHNEYTVRRYDNSKERRPVINVFVSGDMVLPTAVVVELERK